MELFIQDAQNYLEKLRLYDLLLMHPILSYDAQLTDPNWEERMTFVKEALIKDKRFVLDSISLDEKMLMDQGKQILDMPMVGRMAERIKYMDLIKEKGLEYVLTKCLENEGGLTVGMVAGFSRSGCEILDSFQCPFKSNFCSSTAYIFFIGTLIHGKGIAKRLLKSVANEFFGKGMDRINAHTYGGSPSPQLFNSLGYRNIGIINEFYKDEKMVDIRCLFRETYEETK